MSGWARGFWILVGVVGSAAAASAQTTLVAIPDSLDFGEVVTGSSATRSFAVGNSGTDTLDVTVAVAGAVFTIASSPDSLLPGETSEVSVRFQPSANGEASGTATVSAGGGTASVAVTGRGATPPELSAHRADGDRPTTATDTLRIDYGTVAVGDTVTRVLYIDNLGAATTRSLNVFFQATPATDFAVSFPSSRTIQGSSSLAIEVPFAPTSSGAKSFVLRLNATASAGIFAAAELAVRFSGTATDVPNLASDVPASGELDFGDVSVGATSGLTGQVLGNSTLVISQVVTTSERFAVEVVTPGRLGTPFGSNTSLDFRVTYAPSSRGSQTAELLISSNDPDEPVRSWQLRGVGVGPQMVVRRQSLDLGVARVGASGTADTVTISNASTSGTLAVSAEVPSSEFTVTPPTLNVAAGSSQSVTVSFAPAVRGSRAATLTLSGTNDPDLPVASVALSGVGHAPQMRVTATSLDFGDVAVGASSPTRQVAVENLSTTAGVNLAVAVSSSSSEFAADAAQLSVPPGLSRSVSLSLTPSARGTRTGALTLTATNDPDGTVAVVDLRGDGYAPQMRVGLTSVTFGSVGVGATTSELVVVENLDAVGPDLLVDVGAAPAEFAASASRLTIPAGASRSVTVSLTPSARGRRTGTLSLTAVNDPDSAVAVVDLRGEGFAPQLAVDATSLDFGLVPIRQVSAPGVVAVRNLATEAGATLAVTVSSSSGEFLPSAATLTIAPGGSESLLVSLRPAVRGERHGTLTIAAVNDPDSAVVSVDLRGAGDVPQLAIGELPEVLEFADLAVHQVSPAQSLPLRNLSPLSPLTVSLEVGSDQFELAGPARFDIEPGGAAEVGLRFRPTTQGIVTGLLRIAAVNEDDSTSAVVDLRGIGVSPLIEVSLASTDYTLRFGRLRVGSRSAKEVVLRNTGSDVARILAVATDTATFAPDLRSAAEFAQGDSAIVEVAFLPQSRGAHSGLLRVVGDFGEPDATDTILVALEGVGTAPAISVIPDSLDLGTIPVATSATGRLLVQNLGDEPLQVGWASPAATAVFQFVGAEAVLQPGGFLQVEVAFRPTDPGPVSQQLTFDSDDPFVPQTTVLLAGGGEATNLAVTDPDFGQVLVGERKTANALITNQGSTRILVAVRPLSGAGFEVAASQLTIEAGATQAVAVDFLPTAAQAYDADLAIEDESGQSRTVALRGLGVVPQVEVQTEAVFGRPVRVSEADTLAIAIHNRGLFDLQVRGLPLADASASTEPTFLRLRDPGFSIAPGGVDSVRIEFRPRQSGVFEALLVVQTNDPAQPSAEIAIAGTGKRPILAPVSAVDFGRVLRRGTARAGANETRQVTLANTGTDTLFITGATVDDTEQYSVAAVTDVVQVPPQAARALDATFHPTESGTLPATLSIALGRPEETETISLRGIGIHPQVTIAPRQVAFATTKVNQPDAAVPSVDTRQLPVTNTGTSPLTISELILGEDEQFQVISTRIGGTEATAPWHLDPDGILVVQLRFQPTRSDLQSIAQTQLDFATTLTVVSDDADSSAKVVDLVGVGVVSSVRAEVDRVDFGRVPVGTTQTRTLRVVNEGQETGLAVVSGNSQYTVPGGPTIIAPTGTTEIEVAFLPQSRNGNAPIEATLTFTDINTDRTFAVDLTGEGVQGALQVDERLLQFGSVRVAVTLQDTIVARNVGNAELQLTVEGRAEETDDLRHFRSLIDEIPLAAGAVADLPVTFTPRERTTQSEPFEITLRLRPIAAETGTALPEIDVDLSGVGIAPEPAVADVDFGRVTLQRTGSTQLTIRNLGTEGLTVQELSVDPEFQNLVDFSGSAFEVGTNAQQVVTMTLRATDPSLLDREALTVYVRHESPADPAAAVVTQVRAALDVVDDEGPAIAYVHRDTAIVEGQAKVIEVSLTDNSGRIDADRTRILVRRGGEATYAPTAMALRRVGDGFTGRGTITPQDADRGLEFYFEAADAEGNLVLRDTEGTRPAAGATVAPYGQSVRVASLGSQEVESRPETYHMVSVPLRIDAGEADVFVVLASALTGGDAPVQKADPRRWRVFEQPSGGGDVVEVKRRNQASFAPGRAFWVIVKDRLVMNSPGGTTTPTVPAFALTLQPGWNMVGHPYNFPVAWGDVSVAGTPLSSANGSRVAFWDHGSQWETDQRGGDLWGQDLHGLFPWHGYAVYNRNTSAVTLTIQPRATARPAARPVPNPPPADGWVGQLAVTSPSAADHRNYFGMRAAAATAWDDLDRIEPPAIGDRLRAWFVHGEGEAHAERLSTDIRPLDRGAQWRLRVKAGRREPAQLEVTDLGRVPSELGVTLFDLDVGAQVDLRQDGRYAFLAGADRTFLLIVGTQDYARDAVARLVPESSGLGSLHPNPFNAEIALPFRVAVAGPARLELYNGAGQRVRTLVDGEMAPGYHGAMWDGRDDVGREAASGTYLVRLQTGDALQTGKILLLR